MIVPSYLTRISTSVRTNNFFSMQEPFEKGFCKFGWSQSFHRVSYSEISDFHCGYQTSSDVKVGERQHIPLNHYAVPQHTGHPFSNFIAFSDVQNEFFNKFFPQTKIRSTNHYINLEYLNITWSLEWLLKFSFKQWSLNFVYKMHKNILLQQVKQSVPPLQIPTV